MLMGCSGVLAGKPLSDLQPHMITKPLSASLRLGHESRAADNDHW
jgi:hypothetical protein